MNDMTEDVHAGASRVLLVLSNVWMSSRLHAQGRLSWLAHQVLISIMPSASTALMQCCSVNTSFQ